MRSIQFRLSAGLSVTILCLVLAQSLVMDFGVRHITEEFVLSRMEHDEEALLASMVFDSQGKIVATEKNIPLVYRQPYSGHYYVIMTAQETIRSRSLWDETIERELVPHGFREVHRMAGPAGQPLLMMIAGYAKQGRDITVVVAEDLTHLDLEVRRLRGFFVAATIVFVVALVLVQMLIMRRSLKPLDTVRDELRAYERGEIEALDEEVPAEIHPLVEELNHLVRIIRGRVRRSRNALGNLAHGLKAPLTTMSQILDSRSSVMEDEVRDALTRHTRNVSQLIERELKRARLAGDGAPLRQMDVVEVITPLIEMMRTLYKSRELDFQLQSPDGLTISFDRQDLLEILGNLLDNAGKWARNTVRLSFFDRPGVHFVVEDDGPGVPEDKLKHLAQRGTRVDESTAGYGLGLAIVKDIVDHYQGVMKLGQSSVLSGLRVEVHIPPREVRKQKA